MQVLAPSRWCGLAPVGSGSDRCVAQDSSAGGVRHQRRRPEYADALPRPPPVTRLIMALFRRAGRLPVVGCGRCVRTRLPHPSPHLSGPTHVDARCAATSWTSSSGSDSSRRFAPLRCVPLQAGSHGTVVAARRVTRATSPIRERSKKAMWLAASPSTTSPGVPRSHSNRDPLTAEAPPRASLFGVPTHLMALQGNDENGRMIRQVGLAFGSTVLSRTRARGRSR